MVEDLMRKMWSATFVVLALAFATPAAAQEDEPATTGRMLRPVVRGRQAAVSSMRAEASQAAEKILRAGGNAFDAAVAGQAALGVVHAAWNGVGSDAVILT